LRLWEHAPVVCLLSHILGDCGRIAEFVRQALRGSGFLSESGPLLRRGEGAPHRPPMRDNRGPELRSRRAAEGGFRCVSAPGDEGPEASQGARAALGLHLAGCDMHQRLLAAYGKLHRN
jgi:hypothetical protein